MRRYITERVAGDQMLCVYMVKDEDIFDSTVKKRFPTNKLSKMRGMIDPTTRYQTGMKYNAAE